MRRFTRSKKFKFWIDKKTYVFSKTEIKRLISDKQSRSANKNRHPGNKLINLYFILDP